MTTSDKPLEVRMHSENDAEVYYRRVLGAVWKDSRVPFSEKEDVAHDIMLKLMTESKVINLAYLYNAIEFHLAPYERDRSDRSLHRKHPQPGTREPLSEAENDLGLSVAPVIPESLKKIEKIVGKRTVEKALDLYTGSPDEVGKDLKQSRQAVYNKRERIRNKIAKKLADYGYVE
jgi:DNA-binding NtrC family response regulator